MPRKESLNFREHFGAIRQNALVALKIAWRASPRWFVALSFFTALASLIPAGQALITRQLINAVVAATETRTFNQVLLWLGIGLVFGLVLALATFGQQYISRRFDDLLRLKISLDILNHAARLDVASFDNPAFHDIVERTQQNIAARISTFVTQIFGLATNFFETAGIIVILVVIDPWVIIVMALLTVPYVIFHWRQGQAAYQLEYNRITKVRWMRYFVNLLLSRDSIPEVKLLRLTPLLNRRFHNLMIEFMQDDRKLYQRRFAGDLVFSILFTIAFYGAFAWVAWRAVTGSLTVGDVAVYVGGAIRLRSTLERASLTLTKALEGALYVSDFVQFVEAQPAIDPTAGRRLTHFSGDIKLQNVSFSYPQAEQPALTNISLHLKPGEVVAIVGENGAGKTTLAKLIARLYDPTEGCILWDDQNLAELMAEDVYRQVAFVFQSFNRYEASVNDNIAFGNWTSLLAQPEQIQAIARRAQVAEMIDQMPCGYETRLGRQFGEYDLSGGQWQRLAIARAFARDAALLILDEPTASLDARAEYNLFMQFRELAAGRTTILISHRFSTVSMADRIVVLDNGRVIEDGSHHELLAQNGHYAELYQLHQRQMGSVAVP